VVGVLLQGQVPLAGGREIRTQHKVTALVKRLNMFKIYIDQY
jgi:hypothetical protein